MKIISLNRASFAFILGLSLHFTDVQADTIGNSLFLVRFQSSVTGTVSDSRGPLPGVTIMVKGTSVSTTTDFDGRYSITASKGDILVFSFIGYSSLEKNVEAGVLDVQLQEQAANLKEVVINAGYYSVKNKERTGSIARITSKDIETQPITNVLAAMQGRMAGISVIQNSGMPGGGFQVKVRGQNSLRSDGNSPLYIIDGIPLSSQSIGSSVTSTNMPVQNSPLSGINPDDVESIEVLKDADATAIYGSRGANGVVLITTKKGRQEKTSFSANYTGGVGKVAGYVDLMNTQQYLAMRRQAYTNDKITQYPASAYDVNGRWSPDRYTDWQKEILGGTAVYNMLQTTLSGGSAQTQYLLSGSWNRETTVFPVDFNSSRVNVRMNFNHSSKDQKFKISFTSGYAYQNSLLPSTDLTRDAQSLAPNAPDLYTSDGQLNWENGTFNSNPAAKFLRTITGKTYDLNAGVLFSYALTNSLKAKLNLGYTDLRQNQLTVLPSTAFNPALGRGSEFSSAYYNTLSRSSWIIEPQLVWDRSFGKAQLEILAGTTFQKQDGDQLVSMGENFTSNSLLENPASASIYRVMESSQSVYKYQAVFGRINFKWDGKYIVNLTGRRDGSSRFGPGKQFAEFGAVGAAWLFSEESFLKGLSFLSLGKLRASYGTTGNDQIGDYQFLNTYTVSGNTYQGIKGLAPSRLYNPDYSWETNKKLEAALELGFLEDRITASLAFYRNRSSNQLIGIPLPSTTGFTQLIANLDAEVQNSGVEFTLNGQIANSTDFKWSASFNLTRAKNKLLSFPGLEGSSYANQFVIGQPLNIIKVYQYKGVNPQTGTYTFTDFNGDGNFSAADDKKVIKDLNPDFYGGLQNTISFKGFTLDFLFQFVRQENFNEMYRFTMPGTMSNQPSALVDNWQQAGDNAAYQGYSTNNNLKSTAYTRYIQSDAVISDASYIRLKNISLSFDLPREWTKGFSYRISLQGQNVLTFTKYKGLDPEFTSSGYLPPLRIFSSSLQLSF